MRERTEAVRRAEARYKDSHYDIVAIRIPKGQRDEWKEASRSRGMSLARMISEAFEEFKKNHPI